MIVPLVYRPGYRFDGYFRFDALVWTWAGGVAARCDHGHGTQEQAIECAGKIAETLPEQQLPKPGLLVIQVDGEIGDDSSSDIYAGVPRHIQDWEMEAMRDA